MKKILRPIVLTLSALKLLPHWIIFNLHRTKDVIYYDVERWLRLMGADKDYNIQIGFIYLMTTYPEYRNLFYKRIGSLSYFIKFLCPPMNTLFIGGELGEGLFIQHGFATIIFAKSIGKDCWINQQVTIGFSNKMDCPTIGDNVTINAGAKIIGNVTIGNNSKIGANAVVVKNVPENCTVVGVPAYIVKRNGIKVKENL